MPIPARPRLRPGLHFGLKTQDLKTTPPSLC